MNDLFFKKHGLVLTVMGLVVILIIVCLLLFRSENYGEIDPKTANAGITAVKSETLDNAKLTSVGANVTLVSAPDPTAVVNVEAVEPAIPEETAPSDDFSISPEESVWDFLNRVESGEFEFDPTLDEDEDILLTAGLAEAEAGDMSLEEQIAALATVYYRVDSDRFPNSVEGVIYAKYQYATPKKPTDLSMKAAKAAYVLHESGRLEEILPREYEYFFGWKKHNWFYRISDYQIYEGLVSLPGGVYSAQKQIVPEL